MTCASCPPAERRAAFLAWGLVAAFYLATLGRPSFWLDEAWEANFYAGHTAAPWYNRPILYMAASLAVARTIGPHEFALRFLPCAAGIAAIALTWLVARRSLGPAEAWVAAGLLTIAPAFLEASHQLKNYALDAFFTIALVASYERYFRNRSGGSWPPMRAWPPCRSDSRSRACSSSQRSARSRSFTEH